MESNEVDFDVFYNEPSPSFGVDITPGLNLIFELASNSGRVLEIGCGDGRDTLHLARYFSFIDCVDKSSIGLRKLRRRASAEGLLEKIRTNHSSIEDIYFEKDAYQVVVAVTLFDHLPRPNSIENMERVIDSLAQGALLFLVVHTHEDPSFLKNEAESELSGAIHTYFKSNELLDLAASYGRVRYYKEMRELDMDHGDPHFHGFATVILEKI